MPDPFGLDFQFQPATSRSPSRPREDLPFRILILGDFSGKGAPGRERQLKPLAERRPRAVDIDNFDQVLAALAPQVRLLPGGEGGEPVEIAFADLDDFHPDRLYRDLPLFRELRELRSRLAQPDTFDDAARQLRTAAQERGAGRDAAPPGAEPAPPEEDDATLERLLGSEPAQPSADASDRAAGSVQRLVQDIVAPFVQPEQDPRQPIYLASVDEAISAQLRRILHDPAYQAIEAAWRGLFWLISRLETDEQLQVCLLDVSRRELAKDFEAAGSDLSGSAVYRTLVEETVGTAGGQPWSLLLGHYTFADDEDDVRLLARLGALASHAGAPLIAAAADRVVGCPRLSRTPDPADWRPPAEDAAERWQTLRRSPVAGWLALVLPRMLLRLPYGGDYEELDTIAFEEVASFNDAESLLWGNPALACGWLIGAAFTRRGWSMEPGDLLELDDLPACTFREDGESRLLPCGEVCLTERAGNRILERGVMPLISFKNRNAVRLLRFQSLADPAAGLSGRWR